MRRDLIVTTLGWVALLLPAPASAEVRVITGSDGQYRMTQVLPGRTGKVWSPMRGASPQRSLNVLGDRNGDLWPTIAESNVLPFHPWVIWSRYDRTDFDIAWSHWNGTIWEPVSWVTNGAANDGDDLDVDVSFSDDGRPHVVWWRNENGRGRVYLSVRLESKWMQPYAVSVPGVDSRYPTIEVQEANRMIVRFQTAEGLMEQTILFHGTVAITDDINPMDYVYMAGVPVKINDE